MLDEAEVIALEEAASEPQPRERLRYMAARMPGVRVLSVAPGGGTALALEVVSALTPAWLAVADGDGQIEALRSGAAGVVPTNVKSADLSVALKAIRSGYAVLPQELLRELIPASTGAGGPVLTPREVSVLHLLSEGATNKMIARRLDISVHTAKFHVASILDKLDATTRTDAVAQGVRQGVLML